MADDKSNGDKPVPLLNGKPLRPGHPLYDAADRAELDRKKSLILKEDGKVRKAAWELACAFRYVRDNKIHIQDGFAGIVEWVEVGLGRNYGTVSKLLKVADNFSEPEVLRHGTEKLVAILDYVDLTAKEEGENWSLKTLEVAVPTREGTVATARARDVSANAMKRAVAHQRQLQARRLLDGETGDDRAFRTAVEAVVAPKDGGQPLAEFRALQSPTGRSEDQPLAFKVRRGDLAELVARLTHLLGPAKKRGRT